MTETPLQPETSAFEHRRSKKEISIIVLKYTGFVLLMGILFGGGAALGFVGSLVKDQPLLSKSEIQNKIFSNAQTSFAYFNEQQVIGSLRTEEYRRLVGIGDVSQNLIQAIIATEDRLFYEHMGVNLNGLVRAASETVFGHSVQTGGSSLTQQLVKQTILTPEVTLERKAREIFLALRLERMFSKDQILEAYINKMYFGKNANGANIYGVQAAARGIFGVDAKDLNIPQAAYIAGMLQAPSRYIPFDPDGLKAGKERQKIVLERMHENGFINEQQLKEGIAYDIKANLQAADEIRAYSKYPYLMMEIEEQAAKILLDQEIKTNPELSQKKLTREEYDELLEFKRKEVLTKGYHIYTTIDQKIYDMMTAIAENPQNFAPAKSYTANGRRVENALEEVGATLIDNKTGAVLGFVGGRDFKISQVNHTSRPRQPGSTMKPLAAYAPAFEKGLLQPGFLIDDSRIALDNGPGNPPFYPSNYDNRFHGLVTTRVALEKSYNIPAIKAYLQVGIPTALDYVRKMGITTLVTPDDNPKRNDYQSKTAVIGGLTHGVTVEEITNAYSVFANLGVWIDSYMIQKITDASGESLYEHTATPQRVFSEQTAYLMTDMMRTVVKTGTASALKSYIGGAHDVAGKTGTTNSDLDSWFVGYTPEVSLGVWIGYDIPYPLPKASPARSTQIWGKMMQNLFNLYPDQYPSNTRFKMPPDIVYREICSKTGKLASDVCREEGTVIKELFNARYAPTEIDKSAPTASPNGAVAPPQKVNKVQQSQGENKKKTKKEEKSSKEKKKKEKEKKKKKDDDD